MAVFPINQSCFRQPAAVNAASGEKVRRVLCSLRSRVHGVSLKYSVDVRAGGVASRWHPWYRVQAWIFWYEPDRRLVVGDATSRCRC